MAGDMQVHEPGRGPIKRKFGNKQGNKMSRKKSKVMGPPRGQKKVKVDKKMKKLFHKRAREYNSDDDDEDNETTAPATMGKRRPAPIINKKHKQEDEDVESEELSEGEGAAGGQKVWKKNVTDMNDHMSDDDGEDDGDIQPGITKFTEGCKAFKMAFRNVIKKTVSDDLLGPVLSGHKKLVVEKLAEEATERKIKGEAKREKQTLAEKGHVKPATYLDSHEKFLISVATKGVVKLFNAVNKARVAQKGLDSSRTKDAKEIKKRTKEAFFSELGKPATGTSVKGNASAGKVEDEQPGWAPLRDNYMLTSSRLKDWDKMPDKNVSDDFEKTSEDGSSDED